MYRVLIKTSLDRDTLVVLPSTVLRLEDGTPIAWVFLGLDGSVSTLHVEVNSPWSSGWILYANSGQEPYRGRGLAKTITRHLLRHHTSDFGDDGWGSTDISTTNLQSQGVFKSIGGKPAWTVSWYVSFTHSGHDSMLTYVQVLSRSCIRGRPNRKARRGLDCISFINYSLILFMFYFVRR